MLNAARRGPSSVARSLSSLSRCSTCGRLDNTRNIQRRLPRFIYSPITRPFSSSSQWRTSAAAKAVAEDEDIEEDIEQGVYSQNPPSGAQTKGAEQHGPVTRFEDLAKGGMVCQTVVDTITKKMGLETMTQVQSMTISESLKGRDILAQARTGTGKTLAFLIPLLQNIINVDPSLETRTRAGRRGQPIDIRAIIISPTRELAEQIAVEARKVIRDTGVVVQTAVGGTGKAYALRQMKAEGCHVLVGTPGRLNDLLSDPFSQVRAPNLSCFVLDEADRLLDQGFADELRAIQLSLPRREEVDRQTLLYSATVPQEVMQVVRQTMKKGFQFVQTVQKGELATHERVPQKLVHVGGLENVMPNLLELCKREIHAAANTDGGPTRPFKAIVYFGATADVALAASIFNNLKTPGQGQFHPGPLHPAKIIEIHARLSQDQRTRAAETFRRAESGILLSTDVTARGMDFPNVTHVIQIGLPPSEEQYVHRLGRTARGDKTGEGWIFITDLETRELRQKLHNMPLETDNTLKTAKVDMKQNAQLPEDAATTLTQIGTAVKLVPRALKVGSYMAGFGIFSWVRDKQKMVDALNDRAKYGWGMETLPSIAPTMVSRLRLQQTQGLSIGHEPREPDFAGMGRSQGMGGRARYGGGYNSDREGRSSYGSRSGGYGGDRLEGYGGDSGGSYGGDRGGRGRGGYGGDRDRGYGGERSGRGSGGYRGRELGSRF